MSKIIKFIDKQIDNAYRRVGFHWYNLPFYCKVGKYKICVYAMDMNWKSLRIKIEKGNKIVKVIKKGIY